MSETRLEQFGSALALIAEARGKLSARDWNAVLDLVREPSEVPSPGPDQRLTRASADAFDDCLPRPKARPRARKAHDAVIPAPTRLKLDGTPKMRGGRNADPTAIQVNAHNRVSRERAQQITDALRREGKPATAGSIGARAGLTQSTAQIRLRAAQMVGLVTYDATTRHWSPV